jgi:hypothetical protein
VTTNLSGADLRRSSFIDCDFEQAAMKGVLLTRPASRHDVPLGTTGRMMWLERRPTEKSYK